VKVLPEILATYDSAVIILEELRDYIGVHEIVLGPDGRVLDAELAWWNKAYESVRVKPVTIRQSMGETYYNSAEAIGYVQRAWDEGRATQLFEIDENSLDKYRLPFHEVRIAVSWLRIGDVMVELGTDMSDKRSLELELELERATTAIVLQQRLAESERASLGRDLHDSVVQQLFAIALSLKSEASATVVNKARLEALVNQVDSVMDEIRSTIFDFKNSSDHPFLEELEGLVAGLAPILGFVPQLIPRVWTEPVNRVRGEVLMALREMLTNVAKHAQASAVRVYFHSTAENILIRVSDNGIGVDESQLGKSGTSNLVERADLLGGKCTIAAQKPRGTLVEWVCNNAP